MCKLKKLSNGKKVSEEGAEGEGEEEEEQAGSDVEVEAGAKGAKEAPKVKVGGGWVGGRVGGTLRSRWGVLWCGVCCALLWTCGVARLTQGSVMRIIN